MEEYRKWADFQFEWRKIRKDSIHNIEFPFPYREGQKELEMCIRDRATIPYSPVRNKEYAQSSKAIISN